MQRFHSLRRPGILRHDRGARHVASLLAAILLVVVAGSGTLSIIRLSSVRNAAREEGRRVEHVDSLASMLRRLNDANTALREAGTHPTIEVSGAALADGLNAANQTTSIWHEISASAEFDPLIAARVAAWYALDLRLQLTDPTASVDGATLDLEPSRLHMIQLLETVRSDLLLLRDKSVADLEGFIAAREAAAGTELMILSIVTAIGVIGVLVLGGLVSRSERRQIRTARRRGEREHLESSTKRALSMVDTEPAAIAVVVRAGRERTDGTMTALLSDSSRAHFHRTGDDAPSCGVESPVACPAARQGQTLLFTSSAELDACPHLRPVGGIPCGAICVPMAVEGRTVGVLHHPTLAGQADHELASDLELISREASHRIGMVRALGVSRTQASTDPLTGLPNRRELEERLRSLQGARVEIALAFADLDNFKDLNDRHGHATGDKALSLFAAVCREVLRKGDFVARFGGEEFVIVLPGCDEKTAHEIIDRLRAGLADACAVAAFPRFTSSFGLAVAEQEESIDSVLRRADLALLQAKRDGRDRVVRAGDIGADTMADLMKPPPTHRSLSPEASAVPAPAS